MVVKKFGSRCVPCGHVPANGYAIDLCAAFVSDVELSVRFVFTHRNLVSSLFSLELQIAWVLYGQASRAISTG